MADSIRQQIITALDTRLRTITTANGYLTNVGQRVFDWLDRDLADTELDAIVYRDPANEISQETFSQVDNRVRVEIEVKTKSASTTAAQVRKLIEDVYKAIGIDETFGGLAHEAQPVSENIDIQQADKIMGSATVVIDIYYMTTKWSY